MTCLTARKGAAENESDLAAGGHVLTTIPPAAQQMPATRLDEVPQQRVAARIH